MKKNAFLPTGFFLLALGILIVNYDNRVVQVFGVLLIIISSGFFGATIWAQTGHKK